MENTIEEYALISVKESLEIQYNQEVLELRRKYKDMIDTVLSSTGLTVKLQEKDREIAKLTQSILAIAVENQKLVKENFQLKNKPWYKFW